MAKSFDARWVSVKGTGERKWWIRIKAKLDTGAKRCSIDEGLANALGLEQVGEVKVRNAMGYQTRPLVLAKVRVGHSSYDVEMTIADRSHLTCPMILGKQFMDRIQQKSLKPANSKDIPQFA